MNCVSYTGGAHMEYRFGPFQFDRDRPQLCCYEQATASGLGMAWWTVGHGGSGAAFSRIAPLATLPGYKGMPAFSPDGKRLAFIWWNTAPEDADLYLVDLDGKNLHRATFSPGIEQQP